MYKYTFVRNLLEEYISKGIKQFAIYPFGENGIVVKSVLKNCFGLEPCCIIDNKWSMYNCDIVNIKTFKEMYCKDMYVILTIEKTDLNNIMYKELLEFIPKSNIINLKRKDTIDSSSSRYSIDGFERLLIKNLLPNVKTTIYKRQRSEKIKVRIIHNNPYSWNTISTICRAFKDDNIFDLLLLIGEFVQEKLVQQVVEQGYQYVLLDKYGGGR